VANVGCQQVIESRPFQSWPKQGATYTGLGTTKSESLGHFRASQCRAPLNWPWAPVMLTWQFCAISTWLLKGKRILDG